MPGTHRFPSPRPVDTSCLVCVGSTTTQRTCHSRRCPPCRKALTRVISQVLQLLPTLRLTHRFRLSAGQNAERRVTVRVLRPATTDKTCATVPSRAAHHRHTALTFDTRLLGHSVDGVALGVTATTPVRVRRHHRPRFRGRSGRIDRTHDLGITNMPVPSFASVIDCARTSASSVTCTRNATVTASHADASSCSSGSRSTHVPGDQWHESVHSTSTGRRVTTAPRRQGEAVRSPCATGPSARRSRAA
jgi:hypothetical protein